MTKRFLEVEKFSRDEFALLLIENQVAELKNRVGPYAAFKVDINGKPDFPFSVERETDRREIAAIEQAAKMARKGFNNLLWISPPGGDYHYTESRFTWLKATGVNENEVSFGDNKAICGEVSPEKCVVLAECLVRGGGAAEKVPNDPEDLRGMVIGFRDDQIIERLAASIGEMEEVWEAIQKKSDRTNLTNMLTVADWVEQRYGAQMKNVRTEWESIRLGALIEQQITMNFGIRLVAGGGHGMSNQAAIGMTGKVGTLFDKIFQTAKPLEMDSRLEHCHRHDKYYLKKRGGCPLCEKEKSN